MSKPESIKIDPWYGFPQQTYSLLTDNFVHEKLFVAKVNAKAANSTANVKATLSKKDKALHISDEVKVWFSLADGKSIFAKSASDHIKVQYDHGIVQRDGKNWNLYGTFRSSKSLDNLSLRVGAHHVNAKCDSDNRLRVDFTNDNKKNIFWYNRTVVNHNNFAFGLLGVYGITNNVFVKNDLCFSYKPTQIQNSTLFLRLENKQFRTTRFDPLDFSQYFSTARVNFISSHKSIKYGLEGLFNLKRKDGFFNEAQGVVEHYEQSRKLTTKLRVSSKLTASLSVKFPAVFFKDIATTTVGVHANNITNPKDGFKYGAQVEFNV